MANNNRHEMTLSDAERVLDLLNTGMNAQAKTKFLNHAYMGDHVYSKKKMEDIRNNIVEFGVQNTLTNLERI